MKVDALGELEARVVSGDRATPADVRRLVECRDLVSVGVVGNAARRARSADIVTFNRVVEVGDTMAGLGVEAGEVRLIGAPASAGEARDRVKAVAALAGGRRVTGFALSDLLAISHGSLSQLADLARSLVAEGLYAVSQVAVDRAPTDADLVAQVEAILAGGLAAPRLTVEKAADLETRLTLIERACIVQSATGAVRAFAPLPRHDSPDAPATGYDDVKTVAAARVRCHDIARIQVDWPLYGPKLAQVAITFGADDIDGVAADDVTGLGPRRAPLEDIRRQIRAAGADPVERDAGFETRG